MSKITLLAENLWVIRSQRLLDGKLTKTMYYETPSTWNSAPTLATIFTTFEAAEGHMYLLRTRDLKDTKFADGSTEYLSVVSLHAEITHSPNSKHIDLGKQE